MYPSYSSLFLFFLLIHSEAVDFWETGTKQASVFTRETIYYSSIMCYSKVQQYATVMLKVAA